MLAKKLQQKSNLVKFWLGGHFQAILFDKSWAICFKFKFSSLTDSFKSSSLPTKTKRAQ